jgi:uncharacterized protein (TIGR00369 family)
LPRAPVHDVLGLQLRRAEPGSGAAELEFRARFEMTNGVGTIQGGVLAAMLDTAMGAALSTVLRDDETPPTLELKVSFIRPAREGVIHGRGRVVHRGRSVAFVEGELRDARGELLATASSTSRLLRRRSPEPAP